MRQSIAGWLERRYGLPAVDAVTQVLPVNGSREALFAFAGAKPLSGNQKLGMDSFREACRTHGGTDADGNFTGVHLNNWRPVFYRMSPADTDTAKKKAFERARKDLIERGELVVADNIYRLGGVAAQLTEACIAKVLEISKATKRHDSDNSATCRPSQTLL